MAIVLGQGRYWQASVRKGGEVVVLALLRDSLPAARSDLKDLQIEVPFSRWNGVLKHARTDRKLLGGVLLDHARNKEALAGALADDRLYGELQRLVLDTSAALVEEGILALAGPEPPADT